MNEQVPAPAPSPSELEDLIPPAILFADEDPVTYEGLRAAFLADLAPATPYERALAENLVTLEWEAQRHRRMRDTLIMAEVRDLATGVFATGRIQEVHDPDAAHRKLGLGLVSSDRETAYGSVVALYKLGITPAELVAQTYRRVSGALERHENNLAQLEVRRRRLREDYDRLRAAWPRPVEDAEIVE